MVHMDVFNNDAFNLVNMTAAIEKIPYVPTMLRSLIFGADEGEGQETNIVSIEQQGTTLKLIPTSQRGTAPPLGETDRRQLRNFNIPRLAKGDQLFAHQIQGVRAFGTETELETMVRKVAQKQQKLMMELSLTLEYHTLGMIQGKLMDSDGTTTLYNFFNEFGISEPAEIDFDLDAASPAEGVLLDKITEVKRAIIRALGGLAFPGMRIVALCGDTFYDQFKKHNDVRVTYKNWEAAASLRTAGVFDTFRFGEIEWANYRGTDDNSTVAIGATKVRFVVLGVPGLFRRINGPGEDMETVNTIGRPVYSLLVRDRDRNQWVQPEVYAYPLHICTRPEVLLRGRNT
ncbi:MAG: major capsid protein [Blastomonas fulva]|uniref:major capsid protein n=1 Tax=Blastomonas fulva TaxID=1550728 RepID=UPI0040341832